MMKNMTQHLVFGMKSDYKGQEAVIIAVEPIR
jgi:hypothetical protein